MNNKGNFESCPIQRAEAGCDKPILESEIRKSRFHIRILNLVLPIFLAATGCAAGKHVVLVQDSPKPPAAAKNTTGKTPVSKKAKDKKGQAIRALQKKATPTVQPKEDPEDDEWKRMIRKLQNDSEEYWKCWEEGECEQV